MKAVCSDCEILKKGCKIITKVCEDYEYMGKKVSWKDRLGKPVCRSCLNITVNCPGAYEKGKLVPFFNVD